MRISPPVGITPRGGYSLKWTIREDSARLKGYSRAEGYNRTDRENCHLDMLKGPFKMS